MRLDSEHYIHEVSAKLYVADALDFLKSLPTGSVDLFVTSPPYFVGKTYDTSKLLHDFRKEISRVTVEVTRVVREGGSICWQVGNHIEKSRITPLDSVIIELLAHHQDISLRNRIVWTFGHGTHAANKFSGRHETVLWYGKGCQPFFDLDAVRVPQKYPGKRHYKGPNKGEWSGNPRGKNPTDVWDIPNVKAGHVEKTRHPCQFPVALVNRLVLALSPRGGVVVDPYMGSGTVATSALMNGRSFVGGDLNESYVAIAGQRLLDLERGCIKFREDKPVLLPNPTAAVSKFPDHFAFAIEMSA